MIWLRQTLTAYIKLIFVATYTLYIFPGIQRKTYLMCGVLSFLVNNISATNYELVEFSKATVVILENQEKKCNVDKNVCSIWS